MAVKVTLPDGQVLDLADGATGLDAARAIGPGLARAALAVEISDSVPGARAEVRDLARELPDGARLSIRTGDSDEHALELIRHDAAHVLATAVMQLYEGVKISIGPPIAEGFYYDFEFPAGTTVSEADFPRIEERMRVHVKADEPFVREEVSVADARRRFLEAAQDYKVELIDDLVAASDPNAPLQTVSLYTNGPFTDLCRGPHGPSTKAVNAFKLQSVAGAYWRGDSSKKMLTRVYGTAYFSSKELQARLEQIELAKARDHRKLGRELELFMFSELSPGSPFWKPAGMTILNELTELWRRENLARGYREVKTPILYDVELWQQSGHWEKYKDNMYFTDAEELAYELNPGDGAFYGPKIDLHMTDSIGRSWQLGTVQLDYAMPERFSLAYTGADNAEHTPVLIHRALLGSFERFTGIMIEHYAGEFPLWLAPVQAIVMPVSDRFNEYAAEVRAELLQKGLRAELDDRSESVPRKVRDAELRKIPYMLVVGEREQRDRTVSVREHRGAELGSESVQNFVEGLQRKLYSGPLRSRQYSERDA